MMNPENLRIAWITERFPPDKGGMAVSCERQVRALRARGVQIDIFALTGEGPDPGWMKVEARDNGSDVHLSRDADPGSTAQFLWRQVSQRSEKTKYSLAVGFGSNRPGWLAVTLAQWLGIPSAVLVRGNDFDRDLFDARRCFMAYKSLECATVIGAVTMEKVEKIGAMFPSARAVWTRNGLDAEEWRNLLPAERAQRDEIRNELEAGGRKIIGIFGEMKFKKRVPMFLGAMRDAGVGGRAALLLVGDTDEETRQILEDPVLAPVHRHIPYTSPDSLPALYSACDFAAIPSMFEGMPNVLLECMACGAVPIVSDAGAMREIIVDGETGFLFKAEERDAAAGTLSRAFSAGEQEIARISGNALKLVETEFSIGRETDGLLDLFASAL